MEKFQATANFKLTNQFGVLHEVQVGQVVTRTGRQVAIVRPVKFAAGTVTIPVVIGGSNLDEHVDAGRLVAMTE